MTLHQLSEHVWLFPQQSGENILKPNIGIVVDGEHTVLIDAGNGIPHAQAIQSAIAQAGFAPVSQIIYTHHHWDHVFGACVFDAHIVANQRSVPLLEEMNHKWDKAFLQKRWDTFPKRRPQILRMLTGMADRWAEFQLKLPDLVFDDDHQLPLTTITLKLQHVGGAHASDSTVVHVEKDNVLFIGDSYFPPPSYAQSTGDDQRIDLDIIEEFISPEIAWYVDGHNSPFSSQQMTRLLAISRKREIHKQHLATLEK